MRLKIMGKRHKQRVYNSYLFLPCMFTYLNAFFGFMSIIKAIEHNYILSAFYIILAVCMDMCDGRLARYLKAESYFGMELDSLADAISFCLAPTILLFSCADAHGILIKLILGFYLCAGLARLARFNTTHDQQKTLFFGLPTTAAALIIACSVLFSLLKGTHPFVNVPLYYLSIFSLALLMVSTIRIPAVK